MDMLSWEGVLQWRKGGFPPWWKHWCLSCSRPFQCILVINRFDVLIALKLRLRFYRSAATRNRNVTGREIKKFIKALSLKEKQHLSTWLSQQIQQEEAQAAAEPTKNKNRELLERQKIGNIIYQLELVKCGKEGCKCRRGELHGPYWYAYQRQGKKFKSSYIGKTFKLPPETKL